MKQLSIVIIILFCVATAAKAELLYLTGANIDQYPLVKTGFFICDTSIIPITSHKVTDFSVKDNNLPVTVLGVNYPSQNPFENVSLLITFDLGINSPKSDADTSNFLFAKNVAYEIIRKINGNVECAISSFDNYSYLNQEYTTNKTKLYVAMYNMNHSKTSDYNTGFLSVPTGAMSIVSSAKYKKSIVLITDRKSSIDIDSLLKVAQQEDVRIFTIPVGYDPSAVLTTMSQSTGGFCFRKVSNQSELDATVAALLAMVFDYKPAELVFSSDNNCADEHNLVVALPKDKVSDTMMVDVPDTLKPFLQLSQKYISMNAVQPGKTKEVDVTLTARNSDILITGMTLHHPSLSISEGALTPNKPTLLIKRGNVHNLKIKYAPLDSSLIFDSLVITSNACSGNSIYISGGFPNKKPNETNLKILTPACGQTLVVGDTVLVSWTGLLPKDVIQLEYTVDSGKNWNMLAKDATGLEYKWKVPDIITNQSKIRALQLWPNNIGETMDLRHNKGVLSANFNAFGDMVISGSSDSTVKIWNANNGKEYARLHNHHASVNWTCFSPDDKYAGSASDDSTAIIWELKSTDANALYTIRDHKAIVRSINFSPDSKKAITAGADGYANFYDLSNGNLIKHLKATNASLWFAFYNHDGTKFVTCGNVGHIKIWDAATYTCIETLRIPPIDIIVNAQYSPDESRLVAAGILGKAYVWDFQKKDTALTISHTDSTVRVALNSVAYDYQGNRIITAGVDKQAKMWEAATGKLINTLVEHNNSVQAATFNFDGSRILTCSLDSTVKIWNSKNRNLQTDTTDCYLTIQYARASNKKKIDCGVAVIGDASYVKEDSLLVNQVGFKYMIKNLKIIGKNPDDFEITSQPAPLMLDSMAVMPIEIKFIPQAKGPREADLEIELPNETRYCKLTGMGIEPSLIPFSEYIDFGQVEIGDYKDTSITTIVTNHLETNLTIKKIEVQIPDTIHFSIPYCDTNRVLKPGETLSMTIRFTPEDLKKRVAQIVFYHDAPDQVCKISLSGIGVPPIIDSATLYIPSVSARPGDIVEVPVKIKNIGNSGIRSSIKGFKTTLRYNASLLEPIDNNISTVLENEDRVINIDLPSTTNSDSVLALLTFKAALGNDSITGIRFSNISVIGKGRIVLSKEDGKFTLKGLCKEGGSRLFESNGTLLLAQTVPNPATDKVTLEFEIIESGWTNLTIRDMTGKKVKTIIDKNLERGKYTFDIDLMDLPNGSYFYVLTTPSQTLSGRMLISK